MNASERDDTDLPEQPERGSGMDPGSESAADTDPFGGDREGDEVAGAAVDAEAAGDGGGAEDSGDEGATGAADGTADVAGAADLIEGLRLERDRVRDQHLRLAADFDNYRKRTEGRLRQRWDRAQADLVSRLLDPLDDLLRVTALEPETASVEAIVEGVDLVERKFFRVLEDAGIEVVDPRGQDFDPNTMEAMMRVPAESEADDDVVERVFQRGYTFKGLLVRAARVSVFKA
ncbi:MAG: nucleotide exchange factor GrpE [Gemmatimonadetes bacterium]|nr:nucleotide exchange factor GrpE [Gemmatimonadota bacterium]